VDIKVASSKRTKHPGLSEMFRFKTESLSLLYFYISEIYLLKFGVRVVVSQEHETLETPLATAYREFNLSRVGETFNLLFIFERNREIKFL